MAPRPSSADEASVCTRTFQNKSVFGLDGRELLGEILRIEDRLERIARRLLVDEHAHRRRKRQGNDGDEQDGKEHLSRLG